MEVNRDVCLVPCYCLSALCVIHPSGDHVSISLLSLSLWLGTFKPNQFKGTLLMMASSTESGPDKRLQASHLNTFLLLLSAPSFHSTTDFFLLSVHLSLCTFPPSFSPFALTSSVSICWVFPSWTTFGMKLFFKPSAFFLEIYRNRKSWCESWEFGVQACPEVETVLIWGTLKCWFYFVNCFTSSDS